MDSKNNKKESKVMFIMIGCVVTLIAAIAGATYAFFAVSATSNEYLYGTTGFDSNSLALSISQISAGTGKLIPLIDTNVQGAVSGTTGNNTCVDKNDNTVCKAYSITITNKAQIKMTVSGTLTLTAAEIPNLKWAKGTSATTGFPTPTGAYNTKADTALGQVTLEPNGFDGNSATFYIVIWVSEQSNAQSDKGKFYGSVSFSGFSQDANGENLQGITSAFSG